MSGATKRRANFEVVLDCIAPQQLEPFWSAALGYTTLFSAEQIVVLVPDTEVRSPLILQQVPEAKRGKNRMHIDIVTDDLEGEVTRMEGLGASRVHAGIREMGDVRWVTMTDPVGNEFCVSSGVEW